MEGSMEATVAEIAERVRSLRETEGFTQKEMADAAGISLNEYIDNESGKNDFSFTFLYRCAKKLNVEMIELLTGEGPKLSEYTVVLKDEGFLMDIREGCKFYHLASNFKHKTVEPFLVVAPYDKELQNVPVKLSTHEGQEFDYILEGRLKFVYEKHVEILQPGDSVFYDSGRAHGMIALDRGGCKFLAIVIKKETVRC